MENECIGVLLLPVNTADNDDRAGPHPSSRAVFPITYIMTHEKTQKVYKDVRKLPQKGAAQGNTRERKNNHKQKRRTLCQSLLFRI